MIRKTIRSLLQARARRRIGRTGALAVHPSAKVNFRGIGNGVRLSVGQGSMFEGTIAADRPGATVAIGDNSFVGTSLIVCASHVTIGNDVLISWGCTIVDHHSHVVEWAGRKDDVRKWNAGIKDWTGVKIAPVVIGDKAWIGFNSIVLAGVTIGEGAVVGAGSIVTRDVAPYTIVAGNPARLIREITVE